MKNSQALQFVLMMKDVLLTPMSERHPYCTLWSWVNIYIICVRTVSSSVFLARHAVVVLIKVTETYFPLVYSRY